MSDETKTTIIEFFSKHCGYCPMQKKHLAKIAENHPEINFEYVDVETEEGEKRSNKHHIESLPTTLIMRGDRVRARLEGLHGSKEIEELLTVRSRK